MTPFRNDAARRAAFAKNRAATYARRKQMHGVGTGRLPRVPQAVHSVAHLRFVKPLVESEISSLYVEPARKEIIEAVLLAASDLAIQQLRSGDNSAHEAVFLRLMDLGWLSSSQCHEVAGEAERLLRTADAYHVLIQVAKRKGRAGSHAEVYQATVLRVFDHVDRGMDLHDAWSIHRDEVQEGRRSETNDKAAWASVDQAYEDIRAEHGGFL
jgi:hypothetical protein